MESFDVAIVGGGPVGLVASIAARLAGLTVVVLEQRDGTIDKACGEGLMPGALPLLGTLGVDPEGMPIMGITYNQGPRTVSHRFAGAPVEGCAARRCTTRSQSGRANWGSCAGSPRSTSCHRPPTRWRSAESPHATCSRATACTRPSLGSRGSRYPHQSAAAATASVSTTPLRHGATPSRSTTDGRPRSTSRPSATTRLAWPCWEPSTPTSMRRSLTSRSSPPGSRELRFSVRGAVPDRFRQRTRARTNGRVLLVGDASGYVDAITGEGLRLGFAQALAAVGCVVDDDPRRYEGEWTRITHDFRVTTTALVRFATSPLRRGIVPLSAALPGRFGAVVESLAR